VNNRQLIRVAPNVSSATAAIWLPALNAAMERFGIVRPEHQACFIAQVMIETGNLTKFVENLAYRPQAIMTTFRGRFTPQEAAEYGYVPGVQKADQRMIANIAYGGRYGNGDRHTDDGWRYRGRGAAHLTFKDNYRRCGDAIGIDLVNSPEMLEQPEAGSLSAVWFWAKGNKTGKSLNRLAELGEINQISLVFNPGGMHLIERFNMAQRAMEALA